MINDQFILSSLLKEPTTRLDGRGRSHCRDLNIEYLEKPGVVVVSIGETMARCCVSGEIVEPPKERPSEGRLFVNVEFGAIASSNFEYGKQNVDATILCNIIERVLRGSKAIDLQALCIKAGSQVWSVRVDVHAINDSGNLSDCCYLAALCGLLHFRHEEVDSQGSLVASSLRDPVPLSVHHLPIACNFGIVHDNKHFSSSWIIDPSYDEERAIEYNSLVIACNQFGQLCGIHKPGGSAVNGEMLMNCIEVAMMRAKQVTISIQDALRKSNEAKNARLSNIHKKYKDSDLIEVNHS